MEMAEENKNIIAGKVGNFQQQVIQELKETTKQFNFKAYEQSLASLELE